MSRKASPEKNNVDLEFFEQSVKFVRKLIEEQVIWLKFAAPRLVEFVIDKHAFDVQVNSSGLGKEKVQGVIDDHLAGKLASVLTGSQRWYAMFELGPNPGPDEKASLEQQMAIIEKHFVTDSMRTRFQAKTQSIHDRFVDCEWQVSKGFSTSLERDHDNPSNLITLRFVTQKGPLPRNLNMGMLGLFGSDPSEYGPPSDLDVEDLDYLIYVLTRARLTCSKGIGKELQEDG